MALLGLLCENAIPMEASRRCARETLPELAGSILRTSITAPIVLGPGPSLLVVKMGHDPGGS